MQMQYHQTTMKSEVHILYLWISGKLFQWNNIMTYYELCKDRGQVLAKKVQGEIRLILILILIFVSASRSSTHQGVLKV